MHTQPRIERRRRQQSGMPVLGDYARALGTAEIQRRRRAPLRRSAGADSAAIAAALARHKPCTLCPPARQVWNIRS
jgi:hypothetical protein